MKIYPRSQNIKCFSNQSSFRKSWDLFDISPYRDSFEFAKKIIAEIYKWDDFESKSVILVANKMDLVRRRAVSKQGE